LFVYFVYFGKAAAEDMPKVLEVQQGKADRDAEYRILIPLANPDHVIPLMKLAVPIARARNAEIVVLGVVDISINLPPHEGMRFVHHKTPLLKTAIQYGLEQGIKTRSALRIAQQVWDGILQAADTEAASIILMGWKGYTDTRDRILGEVADQVIRHAPCDLVAVKLAGDQPIRRVLVPTAGGSHAAFAAELMGIYLQEGGYDVTCCYVLPPEARPEERDTALQWIDKTVSGTPLEEMADIRLLEGNKVVSTLVKTAPEYDMVVLGASEEGLFSNVLFGEIPERIARYSKTPVMIVKRFEGEVKSLITRIMG